MPTTASRAKSRTKPVAKKAAKKASPARRATPATRKRVAAEPDAFALLIADHEEVKAMFKKFGKLKDDADAKEALAAKICDALRVHTQIEEEIFYPAAREVLKDEDLVDEAVVEHASAKDLIEQISGMAPDEDLYDAKMKVLSEYVNHHVEEEQTELFPKTRRAKLDALEVGQRLMARKEQLQTELPDAA